MADTAKLREAVERFRFNSKPSNADGSAKCSIRDINNVINNLADLLNTFIDELEEME